MKTKIGSLVAISLFLISCGNTSNEKAKDQTVLQTDQALSGKMQYSM